jgi:hypothetical protein
MVGGTWEERFDFWWEGVVGERAVFAKGKGMELRLFIFGGACERYGEP